MGDAYAHLHDLDWLQASGLARHPEVTKRVRPDQIMAEAQALRGLLTESAVRVIRDMGEVPDMAGVRRFLERHLDGKKVAEIAKELGVSREWCSRRYRSEAFRLATMQFVKSISNGT